MHIVRYMIKKTTLIIIIISSILFTNSVTYKYYICTECNALTLYVVELERRVCTLCMI